VLKYFRRERNRCLVVSFPTSPSNEALSFFPWRIVAGGDSCVLCCSPLLSQPQYRGKQAEASPRFPFAAGKRVPCVARGAASGRCCLGVAKAKYPQAGSLCSPARKLLCWECWCCSSTGSRRRGEVDGFCLSLQNGDASVYQCSARAGCDFCCTSTSGNIAEA